MMTRRTLVSAVVVATAIGVTLWWTRSNRQAAPTSPTDSTSRSATLPVVALRDRSGALPVVPGAGPSGSAATAGPKVVSIPVTDVNMEQDRVMRAQQELIYRIARLRFLLADAAAPCYQGGPSDEKINVGYTIVVHNDEMHIENLRVRESSIRDSAVQACLIGAVRDLRTLAPNIGELRQENDSWIALADLADSNRRYQRGSSAE